MPAKQHQVPDELYQQIKSEITSKDSVVGIDAVHTHILIIARLMQMESKIETLSTQLAELRQQSA